MSDVSKTTVPLDAKDSVIQSGEYLAKEAERFMQHNNWKNYPTEADADVGLERWRALRSAIAKFRNLAEKAASDD